MYQNRSAIDPMINRMLFLELILAFFYDLFSPEAEDLLQHARLNENSQSVLHDRSDMMYRKYVNITVLFP